MNMLERRIEEFKKEQNRKHIVRLIIGIIFSNIVIIGCVAYFFYNTLKEEYVYYCTPEAMKMKICNLIIDYKGFFIVMLLFLSLLIWNVWRYSKNKRDGEIDFWADYMRRQALFEYLDEHEQVGIRYKCQLGVQHRVFWVLKDNPDMKLFVKRERDEFLYIWGEDETGEEIWHTVEFPGEFFHYFTPNLTK